MGPELPVGTTIGFYEVLPVATSGDGQTVTTCLGYGGFGALYKVGRGSRVYALKLGHQALRDLNPDERRRQEERGDRELAALKLLRHPNIVRLHAFDRWPDEDGRPFLIMDFVEGDHLDVWRRKSAPSLRRICEVFRAISQALGTAHRQEVFHRDLKAENIIVRADGQPVVVDWGIARPRAAYTVTRAGFALGTATHLSPEYCRYVLGEAGAGKFQVTPQSELHSVGFLFFQLLTGKAPFPVENEEDDLAVFRCIVDASPMAPSLLNPHVPAELDQLVLKLLAKDPAERYASGDDLSRAIDELLAKAGPEWDRPLDVPGAAAPANGSVLTPADRSQTAAARLAAAAAAVEARRSPAQSAALTAEGRLGAERRGPVSVSSVEIVAEEPIGPAPKGAGWSNPAISAAAEKLRGARAGRRAMPAPLLALAIAAAALVGIAVLGKLGPTRKAPESLLAKVKEQEQTHAQPAPAPPVPKPSLLPPGPPKPGAPELSAASGANTAPPATFNKLEAPHAPAPRPTDRPIDSDTGARRGRPGPQSATARLRDTGAQAKPKKPDDELPSWLRTVAANEGDQSDDARASGPRVFGVPTGTLVRARLQTNLDSRSVADGPVTAKLLRPFLLDGRSVFPSGTLLFGQAGVSGPRFIIRFVRLRLPDRTEAAFDGIAYDVAERKPGLAASRSIQGTQGSQPSLAGKVAKGAASTVLTAAQAASGGDLATTLAAEAGRTALSDTGADSAASSSGATLFLDQGVDLDVFVAKAF